MDKKLPIVAISYDFDGTLAPGNMQEYGFMKALKTTPKSFWDKSDAYAKEHCADKNLAYMKTMLTEAKAKKIPLTKETLAKFGEDIRLFKGVEDWFSRINKWGLEYGIEVQHYLISSGLKEIVAGCPIAKEFTKVYACSFGYDENGVLRGRVHPNPDYLYRQLLFQGLSRVREKLAIIVVNNLDVFQKALEIIVK